MIDSIRTIYNPGIEIPSLGSPGDVSLPNGVQAWYEPQLDATPIGNTTTTLPDHSGNGFNITLSAASSIVAGPNGRKTIQLVFDTTGSANPPMDYQSMSMVLVVSHNTQSSFWKFLSTHVQFSPTVLSGLPIFYNTASIGNGSAVDPRSSPDDYTVFSFVSSASQTKVWVNNRSVVNAASAAGSSGGANLTFFQNIGGTATLKVVGLYMWNRPLSDAEVLQARNYAKAQLSTPVIPSLTTTLVLAEGDSNAHGFGGQDNVWPLQLPGLISCNCLNRGQNSSTTVHATDRAPDVVDNMYNIARSKNILIGLLGTNNLGSLGQTAAQVYDALKIYYQARKNVGLITMIFGVPARGDSVQDTAGVNTLLRADFGVATAVTRVFRPNGGITYADYFIDIGADTRFQDPNDVTYYQGDKLHITNAAHTVLATYAKDTINLLP